MNYSFSRKLFLLAFSFATFVARDPALASNITTNATPTVGKPVPTVVLGQDDGPFQEHGYWPPNLPGPVKNVLLGSQIEVKLTAIQKKSPTYDDKGYYNGGYFFFKTTWSFDSNYSLDSNTALWSSVLEQDSSEELLPPHNVKESYETTFIFKFIATQPGQTELHFLRTQASGFNESNLTQQAPDNLYFNINVVNQDTNNAEGINE